VRFAAYKNSSRQQQKKKKMEEKIVGSIACEEINTHMNNVNEMMIMTMTRLGEDVICT
jgi:hypothetical protein